MIVDGQIYGGLAQGIGTALYEEMPFDASGQPLASTLADYLLPGPVEVPAPRIDHMETPSPYTELRRQKGIGEGGAIAPPAAIANAVNDALSGAGRRAGRVADHPTSHRGGGSRGPGPGPGDPTGGRMKPAAFDYARPRDLGEALSLLASGPGVTKVLAGGQSIGPMLNLRLIEPDLVVDIAGLAELTSVSVDAGWLTIGACVTHADIEDGRVPDVTGGAMTAVASAIAYRAVRNRGTIGGSLSHADPAADWVSALSCLGAEVELAASGGRRRLPLAQFLVGALEVALRPGELLVAVRVPAVPPTASWGYVKHCRKAGEFAHAIGAVLLDVEAGTGRAVIGAVEAPPIVVPDARQLFGGRIAPDLLRRFDRAAADALLQAAGMTDDIDRHVHVTVLARAVAQAAGRPPDRLAEAA